MFPLFPLSLTVDRIVVVGASWEVSIDDLVAVMRAPSGSERTDLWFDDGEKAGLVVSEMC